MTDGQCKYIFGILGPGFLPTSALLFYPSRFCLYPSGTAEQRTMADVSEAEQQVDIERNIGPLSFKS